MTLDSYVTLINIKELEMTPTETLGNIPVKPLYKYM